MGKLLMSEVMLAKAVEFFYLPLPKLKTLVSFDAFQQPTFFIRFSKHGEIVLHLKVFNGNNLFNAKAQ